MTSLARILVGGAFLWAGSMGVVLNKVWGDLLHDAFGDAMAQWLCAGSRKTPRYWGLLVPSVLLGAAGLCLMILGVVQEIVEP